MNNYELARELRKIEGSDYRFASVKVERARVDVASYYSQNRKLPFNRIAPRVFRTIEGMIVEEELEPDSGLLVAS